MVGRISPEGKKRVVEALTAAGRYVAMVGDGVNDVPALKAARLAIAQGSGAQMARASPTWCSCAATSPPCRRWCARAARSCATSSASRSCSSTKSAFAAFLVLSIGLYAGAYPLLPRHLTLAAAVDDRDPGVLPRPRAERRAPGGRTSFLRDVGSFAVPAGTAAGLGVLSSYLFALNVLDMSSCEARTVATTVLMLVGLYLIIVLEASSRMRDYTVGALCLALLALYMVVLSLPGWREFFELSVARPGRRHRARFWGLPWRSGVWR